MQVGVLITNGGKHSDLKMAVATAEQIIQIAVGSLSQDAVEARELENEFIAILKGHHAKVSKDEVNSLDANPEHMLKQIDPEPHMSTYDEIIAAGLASKWKDWFSSEETKTYIRKVIAQWTATNMFMHRQAHAHGLTGHHLDLRPVPGHHHDLPHVKAWKYKETVGGMGSGLPESITGEALGK